MKKLVGKMTLEQKRAWTGRIFISPWILGVVFFFGKPMVQSLIFTFQKLKVGPKGFNTTFVKLANYEFAFLKDPGFIRQLTNAIRNMVYEVPIIVMFSLFIAMILNQKFKGRTFARAIFFLPVVIASGVVIQILKQDILAQSIDNMETVYMFRSTGLEGILVQAGLNANLVGFFTRIVDRIFDLTWRSGVQILLFLAGLQSIPASLYEASDIEGATAWESFWKITFPMVSPIILVNVVYSVIDSFTDYGNSVMQMIYNAANVQMRFEYSATMAWIYFVTVFIIIGAVMGIISKKVFYMVD